MINPTMKIGNDSAYDKLFLTIKYECLLDSKCKWDKY